MEAVNIPKALPKAWFSETLIFTGCPFGNPYKKTGFPTIFLGVPDNRKLSNFAPWGTTWEPEVLVCKEPEMLKIILKIILNGAKTTLFIRCKKDCVKQGLT